MTPEKQRIAIVHACPKTFRVWDGATPSLYYSPGDNVWILTDLLTDLNAMHEAEKVFYANRKQSERYAEFLLDVLQIPHAFIGTARSAFLTNHATAAQRAEAFLRTIGKWEEA